MQDVDDSKVRLARDKVGDAYELLEDAAMLLEEANELAADSGLDEDTWARETTREALDNAYYARDDADRAMGELNGAVPRRLRP